MSDPIREFDVPPLSRGDVVFHVIGTIQNAALTIWGLAWVTSHWHAAHPPWYALAIAVLAGLFLADFLSGLLHWAFDTWFDQRMASIARMVVVVREHHIYPQNIFRYRFRDECGPVSWASLFFTAPVYGVVTTGTSEPGVVAFASVVTCLVISVCMVLMLQCHKLGHRATRSKVLRALQWSHLLMSYRHHSQHHRGKRDVRYCLINGWADVVLDGIGFWRWVERGTEYVTGAVPRRNDRQWMRRYAGRMEPP